MQIACNPLDNVVFSVLFDSIFRKGVSVKAVACRKNTSSLVNTISTLSICKATDKSQALPISLFNMHLCEYMLCGIRWGYYYLLLLFNFFKGIINPKNWHLLNVFSPSGNPRCRFFFFPSEQIWRNVALHHLLINGSSVVNGCRLNECPNNW